MIKAEFLEDGRIHTYSSEGYKILKVDTGVIYEDAVDVIEHEYTETDEPVDVRSEEATTEDYITALGKFGVMV